MIPRVVKVAPLPAYRLHVEFDDGVAGTIDLSGELDGEVFQPLRDEAVFRQVTVDEFGAVFGGGVLMVIVGLIKQAMGIKS
jgi:hypothetical protein